MSARNVTQSVPQGGSGQLPPTPVSAKQQPALDPHPTASAQSPQSAFKRAFSTLTFTKMQAGARMPRSESGLANRSTVLAANFVAGVDELTTYKTKPSVVAAKLDLLAKQYGNLDQAGKDSVAPCLATLDQAFSADLDDTTLSAFKPKILASLLKSATDLGLHQAAGKLSRVVTPPRGAKAKKSRGAGGSPQVTPPSGKAPRQALLAPRSPRPAGDGAREVGDPDRYPHALGTFLPPVTPVTPLTQSSQTKTAPTTIFDFDATVGAVPPPTDPLFVGQVEQAAKQYAELKKRATPEVMELLEQSKGALHQMLARGLADHLDIVLEQSAALLPAFRELGFSEGVEALTRKPAANPQTPARKLQERPGDRDPLSFDMGDQGSERNPHAGSAGNGDAARRDAQAKAGSSASAQQRTPSTPEEFQSILDFSRAVGKVEPPPIGDDIDAFVSALEDAAGLYGALEASGLQDQVDVRRPRKELEDTVDVIRNELVRFTPDQLGKILPHLQKLGLRPLAGVIQAEIRRRDAIASGVPLAPEPGPLPEQPRPAQVARTLQPVAAAQVVQAPQESFSPELPQLSLKFSKAQQYLSGFNQAILSLESGVSDSLYASLEATEAQVVSLVDELAKDWNNTKQVPDPASQLRKVRALVKSLARTMAPLTDRSEPSLDYWKAFTALVVRTMANKTPFQLEALQAMLQDPDKQKLGATGAAVDEHFTIIRNVVSAAVELHARKERDTAKSARLRGLLETAIAASSAGAAAAADSAYREALFRAGELLEKPDDVAAQRAGVVDALADMLRRGHRVAALFDTLGAADHVALASSVPASQGRAEVLKLAREGLRMRRDKLGAALSSKVGEAAGQMGADPSAAIRHAIAAVQLVVDYDALREPGESTLTDQQFDAMRAELARAAAELVSPRALGPVEDRLLRDLDNALGAFIDNSQAAAASSFPESARAHAANALRDATAARAQLEAARLERADECIAEYERQAERVAGAFARKPLPEAIATVRSAVRLAHKAHARRQLLGGDQPPPDRALPLRILAYVRSITTARSPDWETLGLRMKTRDVVILTAALHLLVTLPQVQAQPELFEELKELYLVLDALRMGTKVPPATVSNLDLTNMPPVVCEALKAYDIHIANGRLTVNAGEVGPNVQRAVDDNLARMLKAAEDRSKGVLAGRHWVAPSLLATLSNSNFTIEGRPAADLDEISNYIGGDRGDPDMMWTIAAVAQAGAMEAFRKVQATADSPVQLNGIPGALEGASESLAFDLRRDEAGGLVLACTGTVERATHFRSAIDGKSVVLQQRESALSRVARGGNADFTYEVALRSAGRSTAGKARFRADASQPDRWSAENGVPYAKPLVTEDVYGPGISEDLRRDWEAFDTQNKSSENRLFVHAVDAFNRAPSPDGARAIYTKYVEQRVGQGKGFMDFGDADNTQVNLEGPQREAIKTALEANILDLDEVQRHLNVARGHIALQTQNDELPKFHQWVQRRSEQRQKEQADQARLSASAAASAKAKPAGKKGTTSVVQDDEVPVKLRPAYLEARWVATGQIKVLALPFAPARAVDAAARLVWRGMPHNQYGHEDYWKEFRHHVRLAIRGYPDDPVPSDQADFGVQSTNPGDPWMEFRRHVNVAIHGHADPRLQSTDERARRHAIATYAGSPRLTTVELVALKYNLENVLGEKLREDRHVKEILEIVDAELLRAQVGKDRRPEAILVGAMMPRLPGAPKPNGAASVETGRKEKKKSQRELKLDIHYVAEWLADGKLTVEEVRAGFARLSPGKLARIQSWAEQPQLATIAAQVISDRASPMRTPASRAGKSPLPSVAPTRVQPANDLPPLLRSTPRSPVRSSSHADPAVRQLAPEFAAVANQPVQPAKKGFWASIGGLFSRARSQPGAASVRAPIDMQVETMLNSFAKEIDANNYAARLGADKDAWMKLLEAVDRLPRRTDKTAALKEAIETNLQGRTLDELFAIHEAIRKSVLGPEAPQPDPRLQAVLASVGAAIRGRSASLDSELAVMVAGQGAPSNANASYDAMKAQVASVSSVAGDAAGQSSLLVDTIAHQMLLQALTLGSPRRTGRELRELPLATGDKVAALFASASPQDLLTIVRSGPSGRVPKQLHARIQNIALRELNAKYAETAQAFKERSEDLRKPVRGSGHFARLIIDAAKAYGEHMRYRSAEVGDGMLAEEQAAALAKYLKGQLVPRLTALLDDAVLPELAPALEALGVGAELVIDTIQARKNAMQQDHAKALVGAVTALHEGRFKDAQTSFLASMRILQTAQRRWEALDGAAMDEAARTKWGHDLTDDVVWSLNEETLADVLNLMNSTVLRDFQTALAAGSSSPLADEHAARLSGFALLLEAARDSLARANVGAADGRPLNPGELADVQDDVGAADGRPLNPDELAEVQAALRKGLDIEVGRGPDDRPRINVVAGTASQDLDRAFREDLAKLDDNKRVPVPLGLTDQVSVAIPFRQDMSRAIYTVRDRDGGVVFKTARQEPDTAVANRRLGGLLELTKPGGFGPGRPLQVQLLSSRANMQVRNAIHRRMRLSSSPICLPDGTPGGVIGKENSIEFDVQMQADGSFKVRYDYRIDKLQYFAAASTVGAANARKVPLREEGYVRVSWEETIRPDLTVTSTPWTYDFSVHPSDEADAAPRMETAARNRGLLLETVERLVADDPSIESMAFVTSLINVLEDDYGFDYDPDTRRRLKSQLEELSRRGLFPVHHLTGKQAETLRRLLDRFDVEMPDPVSGVVTSALGFLRSALNDLKRLRESPEPSRYTAQERRTQLWAARAQASKLYTGHVVQALTAMKHWRAMAAQLDEDGDGNVTISESLKHAVADMKLSPKDGKEIVHYLSFVVAHIRKEQVRTKEQAAKPQHVIDELKALEFGLEQVRDALGFTEWVPVNLSDLKLQSEVTPAQEAVVQYLQEYNRAAVVRRGS